MGKIKKILIIICVILCILWMGFIFFNSANPGKKSNKMSHGVLNTIKIKYRELRLNRYTNKVIGKESKEKVKKVVGKDEKANIFLRKSAHAFEFMILAIIITIVLLQFKVRTHNRIIYTLFICLLYAVLDEFHQMFVPGRSSSVRDVIIDFTGVVIGVFITNIINGVFRLIKRK